MLQAILLSILSVCLFSFKMADRLQEAPQGSYLLTEQNKTQALLFIREKTETTILLEELVFPVTLSFESSLQITAWLEKGAPGHYSWTQYEVDRATCELTERYSLSRRSFLPLEKGSDHFFSTLLNLPLQLVSPSERKKIGPAPSGGEMDRRPLWAPPIKLQDKKVRPPCDAWKAAWPEDSSLLSSCHITLYFPQEKTLSLFPLWIEASNGHIAYAVHTLATGILPNVPSSPNIPRRPPKILGLHKKTNDILCLELSCPLYYKDILLFAFDVLHPRTLLGPFPFTTIRTSSPEQLTLHIPLQVLQNTLQKHHRYKWVVQTTKPTSFLIESEDLFLWTP
ncbi:MAG: hypothetical protein FJZ58_06350 [Chlamydiae bacterium]|nr:hypothetical protein [Chlamydiota bacterium]